MVPSTKASNPDLQPPTLFYDCGDRCLGGTTFACKKEYSGTKCNDCAPGYAQMAGICAKCFSNPFSNFILAFVLIVCVLAVWVGLNSMSAGTYDALDIGLGFLQILSIVTSFSVPSQFNKPIGWQSHRCFFLQVPWPSEMNGFHGAVTFVRCTCLSCRCLLRV